MKIFTTCISRTLQTPWILALIFSHCDMSDNTRWRLLLGLGAVPAFFVVVCSILETRAAQNQDKADDISASHALLNPGYADNFQHHPDGAIVSSSNASSVSSTHGPFHSSSSFGSSLAGSGNLAAGLLLDKKEEEESPREKVKFSHLLRERSTWINLLVTGGGWFIYDVAYCEWCG